MNWFKYLGHILTKDFKDDDDIMKEVRNLYSRGNTIIKQFKYVDEEVKLVMFKCFCYPIYCSSLWNNYRISSMSRLRVGYNNIFRRLMGIKHWNMDLERVESMSRIYEEKGVKSFPELYKYSSLSCMNRILNSGNILLQTLLASDAHIYSRQWAHWESL